MHSTTHAGVATTAASKLADQHSTAFGEWRSCCRSSAVAPELIAARHDGTPAASTITTNNRCAEAATTAEATATTGSVPGPPIFFIPRSDQFDVSESAAFNCGTPR